VGTKVGGTLADDNADDGCAADKTGLSCAVEDKKLVLKVARHPTWAQIIL
jgi:hypothetical protein